MTIQCPKCRYSRRDTDTAPDWQCPSCGVAYSKAAEAARGVPGAAAVPGAPARRDAGGAPWGRALLVALLVGGVGFAWKAAGEHLQGLSGPVAEDVALLASGVKPGEIVMYSTESCTYCHQAAAWMSQNGFAFTVCDLDRQPSCLAAFRSYGANGTPYLVVRGHHMKDGFNDSEFFAALRS